MTLLHLLKREPSGTPLIIPDLENQKDEGDGGKRIRCPRCSWEPQPKDRWSCSCLHVWNTFDTGGVCPACTRHWQETQCLRCLEWSRHDDWYADDPED
jgi:hypothetical protein